jgi:hypothetical protein
VTPGWSASQEESWKKFEEDTKSKPVFCICVKRWIGRGGPGRVEYIHVYNEFPTDPKERFKMHYDIVHKWRKINLVTVESTVGQILRPASGLMRQPTEWHVRWKTPWPCPCPSCRSQRRLRAFKVIQPPPSPSRPLRRPSAPVIDLIDDDDDIEEVD